MLKERESGIELLKNLAVILIIISHAAQTLTLPQMQNICSQGFIDLNCATTNTQHLILIFFRYFGALGNCIFFISSAWFLCDSCKANSKKILQMLIDVWIISVVFLAVFMVSGTKISVINIIKSIMPTTFANNWYITCYLLFYSIHPYLNTIIERVSQVELLKMNIAALILYCGGGYLIKRDLFFGSDLILFIVIYFVIAYIKKYLHNVSDNKRLNIILLLSGIVGNTGIVMLTNILGLKIGALFSEHMLHWGKNSSPFLLLIAIALFNLFRKKKFINKAVNSISSLSLMIYLIHENWLIKAYFNTWVFSVIYDRLGYSLIVVWVLLFSACIFILAAFFGWLYNHTLQRITKIITDKLADIIYKKVESIMKVLVKIA